VPAIHGMVQGLTRVQAGSSTSALRPYLFCMPSCPDTVCSYLLVVLIIVIVHLVDARHCFKAVKVHGLALLLYLKP
jgi:hypothetical protein